MESDILTFDEVEESDYLELLTITNVQLVNEVTVPTESAKDLNTS